MRLKLPFFVCTKNIQKGDTDYKMKNNKSARALQLKKNWIVLSALVTRNIKNQYRRSVLGILWTVLNPLLNMAVMAFVFSELFGRQDVIGMNYAVYILSGTLAFTLLRTSTSQALKSLVGSFDLMTKTKIPYGIFPLSNVAVAVVNFAFSLIALVIVMLVVSQPFMWSLLMIIVPWLPAMFMFITGISLILSVMYVYFRDISHLYGILLTLWNYLTPVFYSLESLKLGDRAMAIMQLNPMLHYVEYFRECIRGIVPNWQLHLICYAWGIGMLLVGMLVFKLAKRKLVLHI